MRIAIVIFGLGCGQSAPAPAPVAAEPAAAVVAAPPRVPVLPPRHAVVVDRGLAADLAAADPKIRRAAVREVARDPDPAVMLVASRDADPEVAGVAMQALATLYANGQVPVHELIARAVDHSIPDRVRSRALDALGAVDNAEAAAVLVDLMGRGDVLERRTAAAGLARHDPELAVPALIRALGDADDYVRAAAVDSLKARSRGRDFGSDAAAWQAWWQSRSR
ncbi:MAG: HEAT repeat domain-containing protein [Kofleriaceae bacterium]